MKKFLAIIATFSLISAAAGSVTSFATINTGQTNPTLVEGEKEQKTNQLNVGTQAVGELSLLSPLFLNMNAYQVNKLLVATTVRNYVHIVAPSATSLDYLIGTITYASNGVVMTPQKAVVSASKYSTKLSGAFEVIIDEDDTIDKLPREGNKELAIVTFQKFLQLLERDYLHEEPIQDKHYKFIEDDVFGSWTVEILPPYDELILNPTFSFKVIDDGDGGNPGGNDQLDLGDLIPDSQTSLDIYVNDFPSKQALESYISSLILPKAPLAKLDVDYRIEQVSYETGTNKINRTTKTARIVAIAGSKNVTGQASLTIRKKLDATKYQQRGTKSEWQTVKNQIINDIVTWNPLAQNGVDYIVDESNPREYYINWVHANGIVEIDFTYVVVPDTPKTDISQALGSKLTFYINQYPTTAALSREISARIRAIEPNAVLGEDFEITGLSYDAIGNLNQTSRNANVVAIASSVRLTGTIKLVLKYRLDTRIFQAAGSTAEWEDIKNAIVWEIRSWDPEAIENVDFVINKSNPKVYTIKNGVNGLVELDFSFEITSTIEPPVDNKKVDISSINMTSEVLDSLPTLYNQIDVRINNLLLGTGKVARRDQDYSINGDTSGLYNTITVVALGNSQVIKGYFSIEVKKKDLSLIQLNQSILNWRSTDEQIYSEISRAVRALFKNLSPDLFPYGSYFTSFYEVGANQYIVVEPTSDGSQFFINRKQVLFDKVDISNINFDVWLSNINGHQAVRSAVDYHINELFLVNGKYSHRAMPGIDYEVIFTPVYFGTKVLVNTISTSKLIKGTFTSHLIINNDGGGSGNGGNNGNGGNDNNPPSNYNKVDLSKVDYKGLSFWNLRDWQSVRILTENWINNVFASKNNGMRIPDSAWKTEIGWVQDSTNNLTKPGTFGFRALAGAKYLTGYGFANYFPSK